MLEGALKGDVLGLEAGDDSRELPDLLAVIAVTLLQNGLGR